MYLFTKPQETVIFEVWKELHISRFKQFNLTEVKLVGHFRITGFYQTALRNGFAIYVFFTRSPLEKVLFYSSSPLQNDYSSPTKELFLPVLQNKSLSSLCSVSVISITNSSFLLYSVLGNYNLLLLWNTLIT